MNRCDHKIIKNPMDRSDSAEGFFIVVSAPSGTGKTSICREFMKRCPDICFSVSYTTRLPRPGERDGVDYHFVSQATFADLIERGELLEHALVYGQYKGIPKAGIRAALASGQDVVIRVDVQGARKFRELFPEALLIFITPASEEDWRAMLLGRDTDTPDQIDRRITAAPSELDALPIFNYVVINKRCCLAETADKIIGIIDSEHMRNPHRKVIV